LKAIGDVQFQYGPRLLGNGIHFFKFVCVCVGGETHPVAQV